MTDSRPRPQYGEYASPDEQVAAGGIVAQPEPAGRVAPGSDASNAAAGAPLNAAPSSAAQRPATVAVAAPNRSRDVFFTAALLALGAYFVVSSIPGMLDLAATLRSVYSASGYGEYTSDSTADALGLAAVVVQCVLYVVTVAIAIARIRAKKLAFLVPLIGGLVAVVVVTILVIMAMVLDPALTAHVNSQV
jgi:hypothetical protein